MFKVPVCHDTVIVSVHKTFDDFLAEKPPIHEWFAGGPVLLRLYKDMDELMDRLADDKRWKDCVFVMTCFDRTIVYRDGKRQGKPAMHRYTTQNQEA